MALAKWLKSLLTSTAAGAGVGAGTGAVVAPEGEKGTGAVVGGLGGAVAGPGALGFKRSLGALGRLAKEVFTNPTAAKRIEGRALEELADVTRRDVVSTADLQAELDRIRNLSPDIRPTLADVGGETMRGTAEAAVTMPGPARAKAAEMMRQRMAGMKPGIEDVTRRTLTPTTDVAGEVARLEQVKRADANKQYGDVYAAFPAVNSQKLSALLPRLGKAGAFDKANELADIRGGARPNIEIKETPAGKEYAWSQLSLEELDLIKRGLDAKISAAERTDPTIAGALKGLKAEYVQELDALTNGQYAEARNRFRELSTTQEAIETGRDIVSLKPGGKADEILADYDKLTPADQEAFRIGVGRGIMDLVDRGKEGVGMIRNILDVRGDRLQKLFPTPAAWKQFHDELRARLEGVSLAHDILGSSPTARRTAGVEALAASDVSPAVALVRNPGGLQAGALEWVMRRLGHDPRRVQELTSEQLTKYLLNPDVAENARTLKKLDALLLKTGTRRFIADALTVGGGAGAGGAFFGTPPGDGEIQKKAEGGTIEYTGPAPAAGGVPLEWYSPEEFMPPYNPEAEHPWGDPRFDGVTPEEMLAAATALARRREAAGPQLGTREPEAAPYDRYDRAGRKLEFNLYPGGEKYDLFPYLPPGVDIAADDTAEFLSYLWDALGPTMSSGMDPYADPIGTTGAAMVDATTAAGGIGALGRIAKPLRPVGEAISDLASDTMKYWGPRALGALGLAGLTGSEAQQEAPVAGGAPEDEIQFVPGGLPPWR